MVSMASVESRKAYTSKVQSLKPSSPFKPTMNCVVLRLSSCTRSPIPMKRCSRMNGAVGSGRVASNAARSPGMNGLVTGTSAVGPNKVMLRLALPLVSESEYRNCP